MELFDVVSGLIKGSGDGFISVGVDGVARAYVFLENVGAPDFHKKYDNFSY